MPANVVRTPEQEEKWNKAKQIAEKSGQKDNYAYVMGTYKKMGGLEKASAEWNDAVEKLAANYISKLIGTNISKHHKEVKNLTKQIAGKTKEMSEATVTRKGFLGLGELKPRPKFSSTDIHNETIPLKNKLDAAKSAKKEAEKATYKTRRNTLLGAGVAGGLGYGIKKKIDGYEQQNYGTTNYGSQMRMASEEEGTTKEAAFKTIINKVKNIKAGNIKKGLKDAATFKTFRAIRKDFKNLKSDGNPVGTKFSQPEFHTISNSRYNMDYYKTQSEKADKIVKNLTPDENNVDRFDNMVAMHKAKVSNTAADIKSGRIDATDRRGKTVIPQHPATTKKWNDTTRRFQNEKDFNDAAFEAHKKRHDSAFEEALRKKDVALSKGIGLYGGAAGGAGYGIYKAVKRKQTKLEKKEGL